MSELPEAFFLSDGDGFVPTELCRGPWDPGSLHGGPVTALVGHVVERADDDPDLFTARVTVELLKPVPLAPLQVSTTLLRPGKRVRIFEVSISHDGTEVARASVLRILRVPEDVPEFRPVTDMPFRTPEGCPLAPMLIASGLTSIADGTEIRVASDPESAFGLAGKATCWFRLTAPLVDDEPNDPTSTALVAADFGNGISAAVNFETHIYINPDITVYLHRRPEGEWVANDAQTWLHPGQGALAEATLWDLSGKVGHVTQSLFVTAR